MKNLFSKINPLHLLYPEGLYCISCNHPIEPDLPYRLCTACFSAFHWANKAVCARCGRPMDGEPQSIPSLALHEEHVCAGCRQKPPVFTNGYAVTGYDLWEKELLYRFKYGNCAYLAEPLAQMMADMLQLRGAGPYGGVVPVPLHPSRLARRGYNQAELLAAGVARSLQWPLLPDALVRAKQTEALKTMGRGDRATALEGVFALPADDRKRAETIDKIAGERIVLIDDILTTGATASACARVLLQAGARQVDVAVFAAVPDGGIAQVCG